MVYSQESLTAFAHLPLRSEKFFRRRLVANLGICRNVFESIDSFGAPVFASPNQAAAFGGLCVTRVSNNCIDVFAPKLDHLLT